MPDSRTDKKLPKNENSENAPLNTKQNSTNGSRSVKKQILGELKNVMHNQVGGSPLEGNTAEIDGPPSVFNPNKSPCNEELCKQQNNNLEEKDEIAKAVEHYKEPEFDESLFDSWDIDRGCCGQHKSDEETWSEMCFLEFGGFNLDPTIDDDDDVKKDFEPPILSPDLETLPDIWDFHVGAAAVDYEFPGVQLPRIFDFIDGLPF